VTRVKICGITAVDDALHAVSCGAHALGFVMEPTSPRCAGDAGAVERILAQVPPYVFTVAVFGPPPAVPLPVGIHAVQCAGTMALTPSPAIKVVYAIRVKSGLRSADEIGPVPDEVDALLVDSYDPNAYGGTGRTADWGLAAEVGRRHPGKPLVLAGGLNPDNVGAAIRQVRPFAVDVSSGVESEPGVKDPAKVKRFIEAVLKVDADGGR
jgi:phosphoribosylanthranilate isomerase